MSGQLDLGGFWEWYENCLLTPDMGRLVRMPIFVIFVTALFLTGPGPKPASATESSVEHQGAVVDRGVEGELEDAIFIRDTALKYLEAIEKKNARALPYADRGAFERALAKVSFRAVSTVMFAKERIKVAMFTYPELFFVDALIRLIRGAILYPALTASGNAHLVPLVLISPDVELLDGLYILVRSQISKWRIQNTLGLSRKEMEKHKLDLFSNEVVSGIRLHVMNDGHDPYLVPVARTSFWKSRPKATQLSDSAPVSTTEFEKAIDDPIFTMRVKLLNPDEAIYEEILLRKVVGNDATYEKFRARLSAKRLVVTSDVQGLLVKIDLLVDRARVEVSELVRGLRLTRVFDSDYREMWWEQFQLRRKILKDLAVLSLFQLKILSAHKTERESHASAFLDEWNAMEKSVRTGLANMRLASARIDVKVEGRGGSALLCQALFTSAGY
jgi:hypothetical protein